MHLTFSPVRSDIPLTLERKGDVLIFNGNAVDLSPIPEGALLPADATDCPWVVSDVERKGGALHLTILLPHGSDAPEETRFPAPMTLGGDGPVALPAYDNPAQKEITHAD